MKKMAWLLSLFVLTSTTVAQVPSISSITPARNALNVSGGATISVTFSTSIDQSTLTNSTIRVNASISGPHACTFSYDNSTKTLTITPNAMFKVGDLVTVTLTRGIESLTADSLASPYSWSFTIKASPGAPGDFSQTSTVAVGSKSYSIARGDFNGDGSVDLAVVAGSNTVSILTNNGKGVFTKTSTAAVGNSPQYITSGDFDNDGSVDLAVTNANSGTVSILMNDGSGVFSETSAPSLGYYAFGIVSCDLNGDGYLDLAVTGFSSDSVWILTNNGSGVFTRTSALKVGSTPNSITFGDFNGDGFMDLAVTNFGSNTVSILTNSGAGTFTETATPSVGSGPTGPISAAAVDLNGDGALDLAVVNKGAFTVSILMNNGSGGFTQTSTPGVGDTPYSVAACDFDADGSLDLAVPNAMLNNVSILRNNGSGTFTQTSAVPIGSFPTSITSADFNGDGFLDLAATNNSSASVSIMLNGAPAPPQNMAATPGNGQVTLKWDRNTESDFLRYRIYGGTAPNPTTKIDSTTNGVGDTTKVVAGLTNGVLYYFRITAVDSAMNESAPTADVSAMPVLNPPTAPSLISPADSSTNVNDRPKLVWGAVASATTYTVQVSTSPSFAATVYDNSSITTTSCQAGPLQPNRWYYWRVSATNGGGTSSYSATGNFKTSPVPFVTSVSIRGSFTSPGSRPTGLAWDGRYLWIIDNLKHVYKTDTAGNVKASFALTSNYDTDLSWDGTGLWLGGSPQRKIDTLGNQIDSLSVYYYANSGIEWDGKYFWIGDYNSAVIHKHNRSGSELLNWKTTDIFGHPTGISYDGTNLWIAGSGEGFENDEDIFRYSPAGALMAKYDLSTLGLLKSWGFYCVAWDGQSLWYASENEFTIYRLNVPYYTSAPGVPALSTPSNSATGISLAPTVRWNEVTDAQMYHLQVSTDPSFNSFVVNDSNLVQASYQLSSQQQNTTLYWRVAAKNNAGKSAFSAAQNFKTILYPPTSPSLISVADGSVNQPVTLELQWGSVPLADSYRLQLATDTTFALPVFDDSTLVVTTKQVGPLQERMKYVWRVKAKNATGTSEWSAIRSFTTGGIPPSTPQNLSAAAGNGQVTLKWNKNSESNFLKYHIYRGTTSGGEALVDSTSAGISDTSRVMPSLVNGTTYYFKVTAMDSARLESGYSNEVSGLPTGQNQGVSFNGATAYIAVPDAPSLRISGSSITLEAWVKRTTGGTYNPRIIDKLRYQLYLNGTGTWQQVIFNLQNQGSLTSNSYLQSGVWYHVAAVYDGSQMKLYINGQLDNSKAVTGTLYSDTSPLTFGKNSGSSNDVLSGMLDEVRIWNVARDSSQVKGGMSLRAAGNETGLVGCWHFDESSGTTASDATTNGNNGILSGGAAFSKPSATPASPSVYATGGDGQAIISWTRSFLFQASQYKIYRYTASSARQSIAAVNASTSSYTDASAVNDTTYFYQMTSIDSAGTEGDFSMPVAVVPHASVSGRGVVFDGASGYVYVSTSPALQCSGQSITLEAWVKRDAGGTGTPMILDKYRYNLYLNGTGTSQQIVFALANQGSLTSNRYLQLGVWYHVAGVYDGAQMRLYINGILDNSRSVSGSLYSDSNPLTFGRNSTSSGNYLKGQLDEVRIWSVARDSAHVQSDMNPTLTGNEAGLVGYWRMDEANGTSTFDGTSNGGVGTLNGGTSFAPSSLPPGPARNLAASSSGSKINLSWTASVSQNVQRYRIFRRLYLNSSYVMLDSVSSAVTAYADSTNLQVGLKYFYTVLAVDNYSSQSDTSNIASATLLGGTPVLGDITSNATWTKAGSPYIVVQNTSIASGVTLTINPGVYVQMDAGISLAVNGVMKALGSPTDSIRFTTLQSSPAPGQWRGLYFNGTSLPPSELRYCIVEYGGSGNTFAISSSAASNVQLEVSNSLIWKNYSGINIPGAAADSISYTTVSQNQSAGISAGGGTVVYRDSVVKNGGPGINTGGPSAVVQCYVGNNGGMGIGGGTLIRNNTVTGNSGVGIGLNSNTTADSNTVFGNTGGGINGNYNSGLSIRRNTIYRNTGSSGIFNISSNSSVENNTVTKNAGGITSLTSNSNVIVRNNVVTWNTGNGIQTTASPAPTVKFNDVFSNTTNWSGLGASYGSAVIANRRGDAADVFSNVGVDPAFADTSTNVYSLKSTSHVVDAGDTTSALDPDGSIADIGASYYPQSIAPISPAMSSPVNRAVYQPISPTLKWNKSVGALTYSVQVSADSNFLSGLIVNDSTVTDTFRVVSGLSNSTKYFWRVRASNSYGASAFSSVWSFTVVPAPLYGEYVSDASTVLLLHADELSDTTLNDASGNMNVGTSRGTSIVDGRFGKARSLDRTSDFIYTSSSHTNPSPFTIELWFKTMTAQGGKLIGFGDSLNGLSSHFDRHIYMTNSGQIVFGVCPGGGISNQHVVQSPSSYNDGKWHHVAVTLGNSGMKLYLDGALVGQNPSITGAENFAGYWRIGYDNLVSWPGVPTSYYFQGTFDEIRISNKARSPQEFNLQLPPTNLSAIVSGQSVNLNWQNGGGAVPLLMYRVYRGVDSTNVSLIDSTVSASKADAVPTSGMYFYRVSAVDSTGFEGAKSYAAGTILHVTPNPPQNLVAAGTGVNGQIQIKWKKNSESDFLRYRIYRGLTSGGETLLDSTSAGISDTSRLMTGLVNGTTYYIRVTAVDSIGLESVYSNEVAALPFGPPTISSITPTSGAVGSTVTINGSNFNTVADKNIVYFGAVKANVTSATGTRLTVNVPVGATYQPITVSDTSTGLMCFSSLPFVVTFTSSQTINAGSFAARIDSVTGSNPYGVSVGDLDGDGKPDIVVANTGSNTISVHRNTSISGSISLASKINLTTGSTPQGVAIADVDGDGKPDIIVANGNSNSVAIFRNTCTGSNISFAARVDFTTGLSPILVAVRDFDGDGKPDIVAFGRGASTVSVLRNLSMIGSVSFAAKADFTVGSNPMGVAVGDIDGDGKPDLVVTNSGSSTFSVLRGTSTIGTISFAGKVDFAIGSSPFFAAIGDVDGDGKLDVVCSNNSGNSVSVLRNVTSSGGISFTSRIDLATGYYPFGIALSDLNGDGKPDIVVANQGSSSISVFRDSSTAGTILFSPKVDFACTNNAYVPAIGDLDGDGKPDIVATNYNSGTISIFRNTIGGGATPASPHSVSPYIGSTGISTNPAIVWTASSGAVSYRLQVSTDSTFATTFYDASGFADTSKIVSGLSNYTRYFWRVCATNAGGTGNWSSIWSFTTIVGPPAQPSTERWSNNLTLNWSPVSAAVKYYIYTGSDSAHLSRTDSVSTGTSYSASGLSPNTTYWLALSSLDNLGRESGTGAAFKVTTRLAPANLTANPAKPLKINLAWSAVAGAAAYTVFRSTNGTTFVRVDSTSGLGKTDSSLSSAAKYWYYVQAVRSDRDPGDASNVVQLMTYPSVPVPGGAEAISDWQVNLSWQPDPGSISGYLIYRSLDSLSFSLMDSTVRTAYSDTGLTALTNYWYRLSARSTAGDESDQSTSLKVKTLVSLPRSVIVLKSSSSARGDIQIQDSTFVVPGDTTSFLFFYSLNGGRTFDTARAVTVGKPIMTSSGSDLLTWQSKTDARNAETDSAVFKVVPVSKSGNGTPRQTQLFRLDNAPPAFAGLAGVSAGFGQVSLSWKAASDRSAPVKYYVFISSSSRGEQYGSPDTSVADTTVLIRNLTNFKTYYFVVRAADSSGNIDSNVVEKSAMPSPRPALTVISGPTVRTKGDVKILYALDVQSQDSARLSCFYSTDSGKTFKTTTSVVGRLTGIKSSCSDSLVWHSTSDFSGESALVKFKIVPVGIGGSGDSLVTPLFVVDNKAPSFAGLTGGTSAGTNQVTLSWNTGSDISSPLTYSVYQSASSGGENYSTPDTTTKDTTIVIRNLKNFQKYYFVVRAADSLGNTDTNKVELAVIPAAPRSSITGLQMPVTNCRGDVKIRYTLTVPAQDTVQLLCYFSGNNGRTFSAAANVTGTLARRTTSAADSLYWCAGTDYVSESSQMLFRIVPVGRGGRGDSATTASFTVDNKAPTFSGITEAAGTTSSVTLRWRSGQDLNKPIGYNIYLANSSGAQDFTTPFTTTTDTAVVLTSLDNFKYYYFVIRAKDALGNIEANQVEKSARMSPLSKVTDILTPSSAQKGDVNIGYTLSVPSLDNVNLRCAFSVDSGRTYTITGNVVGRTTRITAGSRDSLTWHSVLDSVKETRTAIFRIAPVGLGGNGDSLATKNFIVDNQAPRFSGVGAKGFLRWSSERIVLTPAADLSTPIKYSYYFMKHGVVSYASPDLVVDSTVLLLTGLPSRTDTSFVVRASDALGNQDTNTHIIRITTPAVADFDSNGSIGAEDLSQFVTDWSGADTSSADLAPFTGTFPKIVVSGDHNLNVEDVYVFAKMWTLDKQNLLRKGSAYPAVASIPRPDQNIRLKVDRSTRYSELSLPSDVQPGMISCGIQMRYSEVHLGDGESLTIDSVTFAGNGMTLVYNDTVNKVFYADYGLAGGIVAGKEPLVRMKMKIPKFAPRDSMTVSISGFDSQSNRIMSKTLSLNLAEIPSTFALYQNYPNPFNPTTTIQFDLPKPEKVRLTIYNVIGQRVATLMDENLDSGVYTLKFNGHRFASGVYFFLLEAGPYRGVKKMMMLK